MAYNQARRHPFHHPTLEEIAASTIRVQENNLDTILALAHRTFGAAFQFGAADVAAPGLRECLCWKVRGSATRAPACLPRRASPSSRSRRRIPDDAPAAAPWTPSSPRTSTWPGTDRGAPGVGAVAMPVQPDASRRSVPRGGIGTGLFFALEGAHDLGRDEPPGAPPRRGARSRKSTSSRTTRACSGVEGVPFDVLPVGAVGADEAGAGLDELARHGCWLRDVRVPTSCR